MTLKIIKGVSLLILSLGICTYCILFFSPKPPLLENISFSTAVYDQQGHLLRLTLSTDDKYRLFTPLTAISPQFIEATLLQEDQYFYWHQGLNPFALGKALWQTYIQHSRRMGASTISMQLARLRFAIHSKKISGKLLQIARALQLERHYSKQQILEAYLNLAPYGANIEGVGAASTIYFNISAAKLTLPQALTLSVIPQNPTKRTSHNPQLKTVRDRLLSRWLQQHSQDQRYHALFALPLMMHPIQNLPFRAPHFVTAVLHSSPCEQKQIVTSLDANLQAIIERITQRYVARKNKLGVTNAAVLLVDSRDRTVKGLMGSTDFFNRSIGGQINGTMVKRSPGSTLKPFIYGLALDQGLIHPYTMLKDVPHSFNGYNPENFDYDFMGPIKAQDALILSRNIPAIYLASQLHPGLYNLLEKARVSQLKAESHYGLAINLGGAELTMMELTSLYTMLVNEGLWYPIQLIPKMNREEGIRLLSPEASYLVLTMLQETPSPLLKKRKDVAWKTGTSSGYRDAWTVGSFGPYVLAVWLGNFDNSANAALVGKDIAAPLFFELIEAIEQEQGHISLPAKDFAALNLQRVEVCKASGLLPTRYCPEREMTWFIPGKSPIKKDTIFREVAIDSDTGLRTCHINAKTRFAIYEFWPSDLLAVFKKAGIQRHTPPFFEANCISSSGNIAPQITSPQTGISYVLHHYPSANNLIPLTAVTDAGIAHLYWFVNETYIGESKAGEPLLWQAKGGNYVIRVVDDRGLADAQDISIQTL